MNERTKWSRAQFRSTVAWPGRIRREERFLLAQMQGAPEKSLLDLGCGTGEHSRHFAGLGWRVVGVDPSEETLETAIREAAALAPAGAPQSREPNPHFVRGDMRETDRAVSGRFGAAICLGNTLPFLTGADDLDRAFGSVGRSLLPGGVLVAQVLNYEGLRAKKARHLPLNFQEDSEGGELVFLRLIEFPDAERVLFFPTTLRLRSADEADPLELLRTHRIELRTWTRRDMAGALERTGFTGVRFYGTMDGRPFEGPDSADLVVVARRPE